MIRYAGKTGDSGEGMKSFREWTAFVLLIALPWLWLALVAVILIVPVLT